MSDIPLPKLTGDPDIDSFNLLVANKLNYDPGGPSSDGTATADDRGRTQALAYSERYLHVAYADNPNGTGFVNDYTDISGLVVYQGLRNSDSQTESTNPAEYNWVRISVLTGWMPSYRLIGGRDIDWNYTDTIPANYNLDDGSSIDLEEFAQGLDGQSVTIFYADDADGSNASEARGDRPFRAFVEHTAGTTPTTPTSGYDMIDGEPGADGDDGAPAFNGSVALDSPATFYEQSDGSWPTDETSDATVTFTNGTDSATAVLQVVVDSNGVLSDTETTTNADITVSTVDETGRLLATFTHTSGASVNQEFLAIERGATGDTGPAPTVAKTTGVTTVVSDGDTVRIPDPLTMVVTYSNTQGFVRAPNEGAWTPTPTADVITTVATVELDEVV